MYRYSIVTYTQMSGQYQERERREYLKQYREKNKDRLQQKRHDYYGENKDRIKEYAKQWKQAHSSMVCVPKISQFEIIFPHAYVCTTPLALNTLYLGLLATL